MPAGWKGARHPSAHLLKYEGVSPAGSHKPNTAVAQAFYNKREAGITRIATETGAGAMGLLAGLRWRAVFGIDVQVFMVRDFLTTRNPTGGH